MGGAMFTLANRLMSDKGWWNLDEGKSRQEEGAKGKFSLTLQNRALYTLDPQLPKVGPRSWRGKPWNENYSAQGTLLRVSKGLPKKRASLRCLTVSASIFICLLPGLIWCETKTCTNMSLERNFLSKHISKIFWLWAFSCAEEPWSPSLLPNTFLRRKCLSDNKAQISMIRITTLVIFLLIQIFLHLFTSIGL